MTTAEQINDICGKELCTAVRRRRSDNALVVFGNGACRSLAHYNLLVKATREVLGTAIVKWNGQERVV